MTVVGWEKNLVENYLFKIGDESAEGKLSGSESSEFLQILSMLADNGGFDITNIEEPAPEYVELNSLSDGNKAQEAIAQLLSNKNLVKDTPEGIKISSLIGSREATGAFAKVSKEDKGETDFKVLASTNVPNKDSEVLTQSFGAEIAEIQREISRLEKLCKDSGICSP